MKRLGLVIVVLALAILAWRLWPTKVLDPAAPTSPRESSASAMTPRDAKPAATSTAPDLVDIAALNSPSKTIADDVHLLGEVIESFSTNFPRLGNPIGDNPEITAALAGKNPLKLELISPRNPAINRRGELCDRWGTPFFFHQLSGTQMEIRSAGPDRTLWTEDDVTLTP